MQTLHLPESNHPLVKSLFHHKDQELLTLFQNYPEQGKFFVAIYCRYGLIVHTLIRHSVRSPVQADYLFAQTWRHLFYEMRSLNLREQETIEGGTTLQNWLINITAICINQADLPAVESIQYSLTAAPSPLWCYMGLVLDRMEPLLRLILVMAQTFHWSETRISAYLQAEGESISPSEVKELLIRAYHLLEDNLPADIREIYSGQKMSFPGLDSDVDQQVLQS